MIRLKELRNSRMLRQADLADLLKTKQQTIARYESGEREPDISTICFLCDYFGCTADYLLGRNPAGGINPSTEEESIILALRRADSRAKDMVHLALEPFWQEESSVTAI